MHTNLTLVDEGGVARTINNQISFVPTLDELRKNIRDSSRIKPQDPHVLVHKIWIKWESEHYQEMDNETYETFFKEVLQDISFKSDRTKESSRLYLKATVSLDTNHTRSKIPSAVHLPLPENNENSNGNTRTASPAPLRNRSKTPDKNRPASRQRLGAPTPNRLRAALEPAANPMPAPAPAPVKIRNPSPAPRVAATPQPPQPPMSPQGCRVNAYTAQAAALEANDCMPPPSCLKSSLKTPNAKQPNHVTINETEDVSAADVSDLPDEG
eukprot:gene42101-51404_t